MKIITILLMALIIMGITDYRRTTHGFEKPIFAQIVNGADDGGSGLYVGIGYSVDIPIIHPAIYPIVSGT